MTQHPMDPICVHQLFSSIAKRYDLANHLLSGGLDYAWRARVVQLVRTWKGQSILDLATGSGDLALALQKALPEAKIIGADFCPAMLQQAKRKGFSPLVHGDGTRLPFYSEVFDVITVAFGLRNMESWPKALREMSRVLSHKGKVVILDFSLPDTQWLRNGYRIYLHYVLPRLAHWVTGNYEAYQYLGKSIEQFPRGQEMLSLLNTHGFQDAQVQPLCFGIVSLYIAQRQ